MRWSDACLLLSPALALAGSPTIHIHDDTFVPDYVLNVTRQHINVGGIYKETTVVNDTIPGPALRIPADKVIWIRVYNEMTDSNLTMHWHGLSLATYPFSDGTPLASQWPIPPKHFFDYELKASSKDAGTYYYHSHVGFQANSATGSMIVEDSDDFPYKTDDERTFFIQEFWNQTDHEVEAGLLANPFKWSGEPNGWMINGKSISNYGVTDNASASLAIIEIDPDTSYRFRFIAGSSLSLAMMGFEDHTDFDIIEADAQYTKPHHVEYIQMGSGQRYSALFESKSCEELQESGKLDYFIQIESRDRSAVITSFGILRYRNTCNFTTSATAEIAANQNPVIFPLTLPPTIDGYLDYALEPLHDNNFPSASEVTRRVIINTQQVGSGYYQWRQNNYSWTEDDNDAEPRMTTPQRPYLVSLYQNETGNIPNYDAAVANGGLDPGTGTYPAKIGEVVEIIFQNRGALITNGKPTGGLETHPWHGHGLHHYDIGGGPGAWDPAVAEQQLNGTQPVLRDTTMLYRYNTSTEPGKVGGWRGWRLRIDEPGVWMVHCHSLQHMAMGMQTVWVHGDVKDILSVGRPRVEGYLTYGGNVYGNSSYSPHVVHFDEADD